MSTFIIVSCGTARHNTVSMMFNSVVQMTVSFAKGAVRKPWINLTKALLCCLGFSVCLYCLLKVNTIPVRNDKVEIEAFKSFHEPISMEMTLGHEYFRINRQNRSKDTTFMLLKASGNRRFYAKMRPITKLYSGAKSKTIDSLAQILVDSVGLKNKDSLLALFHVKIYKDLGSSSVFTDADKLRNPSMIKKDIKEGKSCDLNIHGFVKQNGHIILKTNTITSLDSYYKQYLADSIPTKLKSFSPLLIDVDNPEVKWNFDKRIDVSGRSRFNPYFILEDISQSYYNLNLDIDYAVDLDRLEIDFDGAIRFTGIQPQPDQMTMSGIVYTDKKKIDEIRREGLQLYCQFLETSTLQSVRIFVLTAFASLFFTLFWKCVYNFVVTVKWRRNRKNKNAIGMTEKS